ncbi:Os06g0571201 [Oryza sativa Japonica Group]|uniref:Os06g0571201 protein n=1 Tax=Oryza sativa subsp. japonica TaxID=39947 RepID=C7J3C2_ORYSJ|nr:Os06g0571201 [Oryza sativa Japonica Group]|eukprot:NP_001174857.1 Os06g0571201 [Oryza sativa Japonica Group]
MAMFGGNGIPSNVQSSWNFSQHPAGKPFKPTV